MSLKKILPFVLIIIILIFLFFRVFSEWSEIKVHILNINSINIAIAIFLSVPLYFLNAFTWHLLTKAVGVNLPFKKNLRIWLFSNTARFLPGGFWQYPSRIYLLDKQKVTKVEATASLLLEALSNLVVGAMVVLVIFLFTPNIIKIDKLFWVLIFTISLPLIIYLVKTKIPKKLKIFKSVKISKRTLALLFITIFLQYFFAGLTLFILINSVIPISITLIPILVGIFTASWLLGYIAVFAPSGLGVQEVSMATLLSFYIPFSLAGFLAILFRVVLLLAEALVLFFVFIILDKLLDLKKQKLV